MDGKEANSGSSGNKKQGHLPRERHLSAGLPQEWSLRVSQLLTFASMSVRMASSFATTCRALSKLKHIGGLNFRTFLPGPSVLNKM